MQFEHGKPLLEASQPIFLLWQLTQALRTALMLVRVFNPKPQRKFFSFYLLSVQQGSGIPNLLTLLSAASGGSPTLWAPDVLIQLLKGAICSQS